MAQPLQFIGESIKPKAGSFDTAGMSTGAPGLPQEFTWRRQMFRVGRQLKTWTETAPCRNGSGERYINQHWFEFETTSGRVMRVYFERRPRRGTKALSTARWRLFSAGPEVENKA